MGLNWLADAQKMIGTQRLISLRRRVETVLADDIFGDVIRLDELSIHPRGQWLNPARGLRYASNSHLSAKSSLETMAFGRLPETSDLQTRAPDYTAGCGVAALISQNAHGK